MSCVRVLYCGVGQAAEEREVSNDLRTLQELVGGVLEMRWLAPNVIGRSGLAVFCNEEGRLQGLAPNRWVPLQLIDNWTMELVVGPVFFGRIKGSDLQTLTASDVAALQRALFAANRR